MSSYNYSSWPPRVRVPVSPALVLIVCLSAAGLGCSDPRLAEADRLYALSEEQYASGQIEAAADTMELCLTTAAEVLEADHPALAFGKVDLALYRYHLGRFAEAETLLLDARASLEGTLAAADGGTLFLETLLGQVYTAQGRHDEAHQLLQGVLEEMESDAGVDPVALGWVLHSLSLAYHGQGERGEAEAALRRSVRVLEKALDPGDPQLADPLWDLGMLEYEAGRPESAEPLLTRSLDIAREHLPPDEPGLAESEVELALVCMALGDHGRAADLYWHGLPVLAAHDMLGGPEEAATTYYLAAVAHHEAERSREATRLFAKYLDLGEATDGPDLGEHADALGTLGNLYVQLGEYARAEPLYDRLVAIEQRVHGPDSPELALALKGRSGLHHARGDHVSMVSDLERALVIYEAAGDSEWQATASVLNNLGAAHMALAQLDEAGPLLWRSLELDRRGLGVDSPGYAMTLNNIAFVFWELGDPETAERMWTEARGIQVATLEPTDEAHVTTLVNLSGAARGRDDYAGASELLRQALEIHRSHHGDDSYGSIEINSGLFFVHLDQSEVEKALEFHRRVNELQDTDLEHVLAVGSERQRRAGVDRLLPGTYSTITFQMTKLPGDQDAAEFALGTVLRRKGRVLDAQSDTYRAVRDSLDTAGQIALDELLTLRTAKAASALGRLADDSPGPDPATLDARIETLERELAATSGAFRAETTPVRVDTVREYVPSDAVLVEFMAYMPLLGGQAGGFGRVEPPRYAAYVLHSDGRIHAVDLGDLVEIDAKVMALRKAIVGGVDVRGVAQAAHEALMAPILPLCGDAEHLLISPDGQLALVPFGALMGPDGRYLLETHRLTYLTTGRDLLRLDTGAAPRGEPVLVADPDFGRRDGDQEALAAGDAVAGLRSAGLDGLTWSRLKGSSVEAERIAAMLPGARTLTDGQATETALRALDSPPILHAATHGFFLEDLGSPLAAGTRGAKRVITPSADDVLGPYMTQTGDPMLRSGLVLAGANAEPVGSDDGYLTAFELSGLDLVGTRMVVLSACDTGVGEVRHGAGVHGLQRALTLAGAESVVMSLWKVDDGATAELMVGLYEGLLAGKGRGDALRDARLAMLRSRDRSHPRFWAAFVVAGDWRPLAELAGRTGEP